MNIRGNNESSQNASEVLRRLSHDAVEAIPQRLQMEFNAAGYMQRCILSMYPVQAQTHYLPPEMVEMAKPVDTTASQVTPVADSTVAGGYSQYSTPLVAEFFKELEEQEELTNA
ncbi:hypothetical protein EYC59_02775 [Candidatus Saccharibacteria bacterium]|nr:MAG: hypothetical protein EYC59_02775 [Candidatus Saccharibacteria bacterium]